MLGPLRTLPSLALSAAATTLRLLASINETLAQRLSPDAPASPPVDDASTRTRAEGNAAAATPTAATTAAAPAVQAPDRDEPAPLAAAAAARDIATLAAKPAAQVIAAIETLSTTELGDLYIYEAGHRRRRTVLAALETASAPPAAGDDDDLPPLDVRIPDELVYSTVGAKRPNG